MAASNSGRLAAFLLIAVFANATLSCAQTLGADAHSPVAPATAQLLEQMTGAAAVVFAGEVISIRRPTGYAGSAQAAAEGVVIIGFRVGEAVRGCVSGSVYTLREWAGLWLGTDRYRVGQRLLIFLHNADQGGLSSPVHGVAGAIPLRGGGVAPGPYDASARAADWVVDLRWVEAQALREVAESGTPVLGTAGGTGRRLVSEEWPQPVRMSASSGSPDRPEISPAHNGFVHWTALPRPSDRSMPLLAEVLSLCREWANASPGSDPAERSIRSHASSQNSTGEAARIRPHEVQ